MNNAESASTQILFSKCEYVAYGVIRRQGFIVLDVLWVLSVFYHPDRFISEREKKEAYLNQPLKQRQIKWLFPY